MTSPEVFYLHIHGEQRGPYTIPQVDHLLNSGLIAEETLFWREGLDQWQPVTSLVTRRKKANPWVKPAIVLGVGLVLAVLAEVFGSIVLLGWREANQHAYTAEAAYWRARSVVRGETLPRGTLVEFQHFSPPAVTLQPPQTATVLLHGDVTDSGGQTRRMVWTVPMNFNAHDAEWTGGPAHEVAPAP
jgi:hypothetical protein